MATEIKKVNFLVKFNNEIKLMSLEAGRKNNFNHFRDLVYEEFKIATKYKLFLYVEHNANSSNVPFDSIFYDEIMTHVQELGPTHIVNIRAMIVWNFIFSASLAHQVPESRGDSVERGVGAFTTLQRKVSDALPCSVKEDTKRAPRIQADDGLPVISLPPADPVKKSDSFDDVEEFDSVGPEHKVESGIDHITHHYKTDHTPTHSTVKIDVFDDVTKPYTAQAAQEHHKSLFSPRNSKKIDAPDFPEISDLPNYDLNSKQKGKISLGLYENTGPTGEITKTFSKLSPQIKLLITNESTETVDSKFKLFKICGKCDYNPVALPLIVAGKQKVLVISPEFDSLGDAGFRGIALFALGSESDGKTALFGQILKVEVNSVDAWAKVRFVNEKEAYQVYLQFKSNKKPRTEILGADELKRVKDFIDSLDYDKLKLKKYTGKVFEDYRQLNDSVKGVDRVIGCELIKADIIPFTLLLQYAAQSDQFRALLRSRV